VPRSKREGGEEQWTFTELAHELKSHFKLPHNMSPQRKEKFPGVGTLPKFEM